MTPEQLDLMVSRTGAERLRRVTADDWPDARERGEARRWVEDMAAEPTWPPPCDGYAKSTDYPPLLEQATNVAKAAGRFVASGFKTVDKAEFDRRHEICEACDRFDAAKSRCKSCGCRLAIKPWSKAERCPLGKW